MDASKHMTCHNGKSLFLSELLFQILVVWSFSFYFEMEANPCLWAWDSDSSHLKFCVAEWHLKLVRSHFASDSCQGHESPAPFSWVKVMLGYNLHSEGPMQHQATPPSMGDFSWNDTFAFHPFHVLFPAPLAALQVFLGAFTQKIIYLRICFCGRWLRLVVAPNSYFKHYWIFLNKNKSFYWECNLNGLLI